MESYKQKYIRFNQ